MSGLKDVSLKDVGLKDVSLKDVVEPKNLQVGFTIQQKLGHFACDQLQMQRAFYLVGDPVWSLL